MERSFRGHEGKPRRFRNALPLLSAILMACTAIALILSFGDDRRTYVSLTPKFHLGILDGHVDFFNDRFARQAVGYDTSTADRRVFWDNPFFDYRYIRWGSTGPTVWALRVPLFWLLVTFAVLLVISTRLKRHAEKAALGNGQDDLAYKGP